MATSTLVKHQQQDHGPRPISGWGYVATITAHIRFDDRCGNGHNTFSITATVREEGRRDVGGCLHDDVARCFPALAPFIKFHLCSTDGPMHYIANTVYHVEQGKLDYARSSACWPDATDEDLTAPGLRERLEARLPALLAEFRTAMESLGFTW